MEYTLMPTFLIKELERFLKAEKEKTEWISEDEALVIFGKPGKPMAQGSLYNKIRANKIPASFYKICPITGKRKWNKKLIS